jgi:hypothetical protein
MGEFTKTIHKKLKGELPVLANQLPPHYDVVLKVRSDTGEFLGVGAPQGIPPIVVIEILAIGIKKLSEMILKVDQEPKRIQVVPKIPGLS